MTVVEIAEMQAIMKENKNTIEPLTFEKKLELILNTIPEEPTPTIEPKLGYKWSPSYSPSNGFIWEQVEDSNALGTLKNPWYQVEGMAITAGHHYTTNGNDIYVALQDSIPFALSNEEGRFYKV